VVVALSTAPSSVADTATCTSEVHPASASFACAPATNTGGSAYNGLQSEQALTQQNTTRGGGGR
jgi:hypothetical protein